MTGAWKTGGFEGGEPPHGYAQLVFWLGFGKLESYSYFGYMVQSFSTLCLQNILSFSKIRPHRKCSKRRGGDVKLWDQLEKRFNPSVWTDPFIYRKLGLYEFPSLQVSRLMAPLD